MIEHERRFTYEKRLFIHLPIHRRDPGVRHLVYAYAEMIPGAFEGIRCLDNILYTPGGPIINDQLPAVPFFNAQ